MTSLPIVIPQDYDIVVSKGDKVKTGDVLAKKQHSPSEIVIQIAEKLNVSPKSVGRMLTKNPGDRIETGDVLAKKEGLFGDALAISTISGTFSTYNRSDGSVIIKLLDSQTSVDQVDEILCPLDGVVSICHNGKIVLETEKNVLLGEKGTGQTFRGILKVSDVTSSDPIPAEKITTDEIDCVFLGPAFTQEAFAKASAIGVGGILTLALDNNDIDYIEEKRLSIPVIQVSEDVGKTISKWKNKEVFVDGDNKAILLLSYEKSTR